MGVSDEWPPLRSGGEEESSSPSADGKIEAMSSLLPSERPNQSLALSLTLRLMGHVVFAGEMQGTMHRFLLETRQNELKPGSVLLLKQVGGLLWRPAHLSSHPGEGPQVTCMASFPPRTQARGARPCARPWLTGAE